MKHRSLIKRYVFNVPLANLYGVGVELFGMYPIYANEEF